MSTKSIREPRMIFSSDYMHMAEAGELSKIVTIPAMAIAAGVRTANGYIDVDMPTPKGAISRSIVAYQGANVSSPSYVLSNGSLRVNEVFRGYFYWQIFWARQSDQKIRVYYYVIRLNTANSVNVPSLTFTIIQQYLKAPN